MLTVKPVVGKMWDVNRRMDRLVAGWLETHESPNTRAAYQRDVAAFASWCDVEGVGLLDAGPRDIARFRDSCLAAGERGSTVTRRLSGVASFFRYAKSAGVATRNPTEQTRRPAHDHAAPATLSPAEVDALMDAADALGPKTAALIGLLALDGIKLNEALAIDVQRVQVAAHAAAVEVDRRGERQQVDVDARTATAVAAYVAGRRRGPLFVGDSAVAHKPARLTRFGADFLIKRAGAAAGIEKGVSANVLRRSYIERARNAGTPLSDIAHQVGHREVRETARLLEGRS